MNKQTMRFSQTELELMKSAFQDRDEVLFALRRHFLQQELNENEQEMIKAVLNEDVFGLVKKVFLPDIDDNGIIPLGQISSLWFQVHSDIKSVPVEDTFNIIKSRELFIKYITQQLRLLEGTVIESDDIILLKELLETEEIDAEDLLVNMKAWNSIVSYVEQMLLQIRQLAEIKEISEDELKEKHKKNSTK